MSSDRLIVDRLKVFGIALITATLIIGALGLGATIDLPEGGIVASGDVTTGEGTLYLDRSGTSTAVGEIVNDRRESITDVVVTVQFVEDGTVVGTVEASTVAEKIAPESRVPFSARLDTGDDPDEIRVGVDFEPATTTDDVRVSEHEVSDRTSDSVTVVGEVTNVGSEPVSPEVIVTFYDDGGTVIGYRTSRVSPDPVEPGENAGFHVRYATLGDIPSLAREYASYRIAVTKK